VKKNSKPLAAVTGASSGIGYELAKEFARNGFDLIVVAEDDGIFEVPVQFEELGAEVKAVKINLAKRKGVEKFHQEIKALGRGLDAIALNAGVGTSGDFVRETDFEEELNIINLNITSTVYLAKLVLKDMVKKGEGKVLFTSSIAGTMPAPLLAVYAASKAFVESFAQAIRNELKDSGVSVTTLLPDATETEFFERAHMEDTEVGVSEKDHPADVAKKGFKALMDGQDHVTMSTLVTQAMGKILPDKMAAKEVRKDNEPAKKH
jgi:uncharacterized protein